MVKRAIPKDNAVWQDLPMMVHGVEYPYVRALCFPDIGLAITRPYTRFTRSFDQRTTGWMIIHMNTGRMVTGVIYRALSIAIKMLKFAATLTDWTTSGDDIRIAMRGDLHKTMITEFRKHQWRVLPLLM